MPFDNGTFSVCFGRLPKALPEDAMERFVAKRAGSLASVIDEPQVGWVSGRHLLETRIDEETAMAGGYWHLHLRTATRKIPSSLFKAECRIEELALQQSTKSHFVSRKAKKEIQQGVTDRLLKDMPPTLGGIPLVIDGPNQMAYVAVAGAKQFEHLAGHFRETMGFEPAMMTPAETAIQLFGTDPTSLRALHFSPNQPPFNAEQTLGRDFCTWLWFYKDTQGGTFRVAERGDFGFTVDGPLTFASEGSGAMESVVRKGLPTLSAEAKSALMVGKKLRQARFTLARDKEIWNFTLDADTFALRGISLPAGEELDPGSHFQERIMALTVLREAFWALFELYLEQLTEAKRWEKLQPAIYEWVNGLEEH